MSGNPENLTRAVGLEPDNPKYRLLAARQKELTTGADAAERELRLALQFNPRSAQALMDLALDVETAGRKEEAERLLLQAVELDKTFKPAWTLANFYFRGNSMEKMWPFMGKAIDITTKPGLEYFDLDLNPVFDLCWQAENAHRHILGILPARHVVHRLYFIYLVLHGHTAEAGEVFEAALQAADPKSDGDRGIFARYADLIFQSGKQGEAARIWNRLCEKGLLHSKPLHPERAEGIADPNFTVPFEPAPFGWWSPSREITGTTYAPGSVWFEFQGQQPEALDLLIKQLAVLPDKDYFLTWNAAPERMNIAPLSAGLGLLFTINGKPLPVQCSPFLAPQQTRGCKFHVPGGVESVQMHVVYQRQPGTVRLRGTLQVSGFALSFADRPKT